MTEGSDGLEGVLVVFWMGLLGGGPGGPAVAIH